MNDWPDKGVISLFVNVLTLDCTSWMLAIQGLFCDLIKCLPRVVGALVLT